MLNLLIFTYVCMWVDSNLKSTNSFISYKSASIINRYYKYIDVNIYTFSFVESILKLMFFSEFVWKLHQTTQLSAENTIPFYILTILLVLHYNLNIKVVLKTCKFSIFRGNFIK